MKPLVRCGLDDADRLQQKGGARQSEGRVASDDGQQHTERGVRLAKVFCRLAARVEQRPDPGNGMTFKSPLADAVERIG